MKRFLFLASMLAIAASCTVSEPDSSSVQAPAFYASTEGNDTPTKTSISVDEDGVGTIWWKPAEKINVFFGTASVTYTSTNTEDATIAVFETTSLIGYNEGASCSKWSLYPYDAKATCDGSSVTTTVANAQSCVAGTFGTNLFPMVAQTSNNELHFLNVCGGIKFSLSRDDIEKITFKGNNNEDLAGKVQITMGADGKPASSVLAGENTITLTPASGSTFAKDTDYYIVMLPTVLTGGFTMTFETASMIGTFNYTEKSVEIKRSVFGKKAAIDTFAEFYEKSPEGSVDLGLSVKWASCNLGASKPEDLGGYYQWAGTEDVTDTSIYLDWSNCPYHTGSSDYTGWTKYNTISSYGTVDNKTVLDPDDDAARANLGGKWRMPEKEEWAELKDTRNCAWTWTSINGIEGYKVQSKKPGFTDKWIFLPAAGYRNGDGVYYVGTYGEYMSSTLNSGVPCNAAEIYFGSNKVYSDNGGRYLGRSVRPVYGKRVQVTGLSLNTYSLTLPAGESATLIATVTPANAPEKGIVWSSSDGSVATVDNTGKIIAFSAGIATISAKTVDGDHTAVCEVTVESSALELVDLGLPSGIKWASCNLGAEKPEDLGGYYQWAGTEDVTSSSIHLSWNNCPYHTGASEDSGWTKYNTISSYGTVDNKTVLDSDDDAARAKLGGKRRIPTNEEWEELLNNCTSEWITLNGTGGRMFTSKENGKSIFLPAAGFRNGSGVSDKSWGYYWSSSLHTSSTENAYNFIFTSDNAFTLSDVRFRGQSVRPVSE